jgi:hypothetical protein
MIAGTREGEVMFESDESGSRGDSGDEDAMTPQPEPGHPTAGEDVGAPEEGLGRAKAQATEPIGDQDQVKGQTAHPAPDDDVGAPPIEGSPTEE